MRIHLLYDETKAELRHEVEWEGIVRINDSRIDPDDALAIDLHLTECAACREKIGLLEQEASGVANVLAADRRATG